MTENIYSNKHCHENLFEIGRFLSFSDAVHFARTAGNVVWFSTGDYLYKTKDYYCHLIRKGRDLLAGKKAVHAYVFNNGDYLYRTENGKLFLMRRGKNLLEGIDALDCISCQPVINRKLQRVCAPYAYKDANYFWHLIVKKKKNGKKIDMFEGLNVGSLYYHSDEFDFITTDKIAYRIKQYDWDHWEFLVKQPSLSLEPVSTFKYN